MRQKIFITYILISFFSSCQTSKKNSTSLTTANELARDGLYREALNSYSKVLKRNPNNPEALKNIGGILIRLKNYKKGVSYLQKALSYYPNLFECHFFLAEGYRALDNYSQAIFHYQYALSLRPKHSGALKGLAWSYYKIRFYSEALKKIQLLKTHFPQDNHIDIMHIRTLLKLKRIKTAERVLSDKMIKLSAAATRPYLLSLKGDVLFERGYFSQALSYYRKSLELKPLLASTLLGISRCYLQKNKKEKAKKYLERALRVRPHLKEAYPLLAKIYEKIHRKKALSLYESFYEKIKSDPEYLNELPKIKRKIALLRNDIIR